LFLITALVLGASTVALAQNGQGGRQEDRGEPQDRDDHGRGADKVLYIWAQDQAKVAPDFLAVIDFDEQSPKYGEVINVVPLPPPGNIGNEPHHCHLNFNQDHPGMRGTPQPLKESERHLFLRRNECEEAEVSDFRQSRGIEYDGRLHAA
jgi:selenium-binding protein 1